MDGMLTVINLDVPSEGSEDMRTLADVFERTIRGILGEEYQVNVYQIGGVSVNSNSIQNDNENGSKKDQKNKSDSSKKRKQRQRPRRNLQTGSGNEEDWVEWDTSLWEKNEETNWEPGLEDCPVDRTQIPVFFELKVVRSCFNCDEEKAFAKAAGTYRETFAVLDDAVKSGDMSRAFCINAVRAGVVPTFPCEVSITCVMGTSFFYQDVNEIIGPTSQPTPIDTYEPSKSPFSFLSVSC